MKLSIIIPSNRGPDRVRPLLQSLMAQRLTESEMAGIEILWVVNGQGFEFCQHLRDEVDAPLWRERFQFLYLQKAHANLARNLGAESATGRSLFFLDDDLEFPSVYSLKRILEWIAAKDSQRPWALGGVYSLGRHTKAGKAYFRLSRRFWNTASPVAFLLGGFLILPRQLFLEIGGFSESRSWGGSELLLNDELRARRVQIERDDRLHLMHHLPLSGSDLIRKGLKQGEGARLIRPHDQGQILEPLLRDWHTRLYLVAFHLGLRSPKWVRRLVLSFPRLLDFHLFASMLVLRVLRLTGYRSKWAWRPAFARRWSWLFVPSFILERAH